MAKARKEDNEHLKHGDKRYEETNEGSNNKSNNKNKETFGEQRESGSDKKMSPQEAGHLGGTRQKKEDVTE